MFSFSFAKWEEGRLMQQLLQSFKIKHPREPLVCDGLILVVRDLRVCVMLEMCCEGCHFLPLDCFRQAQKWRWRYLL